MIRALNGRTEAAVERGRKRSSGTDTGATWQGRCPARVGSDGEGCRRHSGPGMGGHDPSARTLGPGQTGIRDASAPTGQPETARGETPGPSVPNDPRPEWARGPCAISQPPVFPAPLRLCGKPSTHTTSAPAEPTRPPRARSITVRVQAGRSKRNSWSNDPEGRPGQFEDGYVRLHLKPDGHHCPAPLPLPHAAVWLFPRPLRSRRKDRQALAGSASALPPLRLGAFA